MLSSKLVQTLNNKKTIKTRNKRANMYIVHIYKYSHPQNMYIVDLQIILPHVLIASSFVPLKTKQELNKCLNVT